jgi:hypothetical protein
MSKIVAIGAARLRASISPFGTPLIARCAGFARIVILSVSFSGTSSVIAEKIGTQVDSKGTLEFFNDRCPDPQQSSHAARKAILRIAMEANEEILVCWWVDEAGNWNFSFPEAPHIPAVIGTPDLMLHVKWDVHTELGQRMQRYAQGKTIYP